MTLIKSISGIRGTIGGEVNENLTAHDLVQLVSAYATLIQNKSKQSNIKIAIGRDGRISGAVVQQLAISTLQMMGVDVYDLGLTTTPTVEYYVLNHKLDGGIIISASHNPKQWNALKLLNAEGEFLNAEDGQTIIQMSADQIRYASVDELGKLKDVSLSSHEHIEAIKALPYVDVKGIAKTKFKVVVDGINSSGGLMIPELLRSLGIEDIEVVHGVPHGDFAHNPEPLEQNLTDLIQRVKDTGADMGIAVDPDVDRLVFVSEDGTMFGEEYTLVACSDLLLRTYPDAPLVSNMSSTLALKDLADSHSVAYFSAPVGELHVVQQMKKIGAKIGGEGNGGVILADLHYGRDALVGVALMLSLLVQDKTKLSELKKRYSHYLMAKDKLSIEGVNKDEFFAKFKAHFAAAELDERDGIKATLDKAWVHIRASNTEPIIRIYAEAKDQATIDRLVAETKAVI